jgi:glycoside hydrolase-like protein
MPARDAVVLGRDAMALGRGSAVLGRGSAALGRARAAGAGTTVVTFAGYTIDVPANWPVYRLARDPYRCVRYDQNALYLGQPGANQQCPAHLAGRVATLSLVKAHLTVSERRQLPARGVVAWDSADHEMGALLPRHPLSIAATYGGAAGQVKGILATLRWAATGQPAGAVLTRGATPGAPGWPAARFLRHRAGAVLTRGALPHGPLAGLSGAGRRAAPKAGLAAAGAGLLPGQPARGRHHHKHRKHHKCHYRCCHHRLCHPRWLKMPVKGMDTCTAPSLRAMRAWHHAFKAAAIYLGGPEAACGWGNLSAAWIRASVRMGWAMIPAYVGPQAPCTRFRVRIRAGRAEWQGRASARNAIRLAQLLGMHRGAVLYDDMEAYRPHHGRCSRPVVAFLDGWTRELHARGYRAGVYSSAAAAARDLGRYRHVYGHPVARPNSLWFALWDGRRNLRGTPYVRRNWWHAHRIKQYKGARHRRIGGIRLSFDSDLVDGAVYR